MTDETSQTPNGAESPDSAKAGKGIADLIPRTPGTIFRAILGVLLFFCGILLGFWLIFRFRREA
jgi:hypothetical protein